MTLTSLVAGDADRLYRLYSEQALSYAIIVSVMQRVAAEAYQKGVRDGGKPLAALSAEVDARMAKLASQEVGDAGYDLHA